MKKSILIISLCTISSQFLLVNKKSLKVNILQLFSIVFYFIASSSFHAQSDSWISKTKMPTARTFLSACVVEEKLYVIGGATTSSGTSTVEMYDPANDIWQKKANMPVARCYPMACALNGMIYVFGGTTGMWSTAEKSIYLYDPQKDSWSQKSDMPFTIGASGVAVIENTIYFLGSTQSSSSPPTATVFAYDPISESWTQKADMPTPRCLLSASVIDGIIYTIGGTNENWETVSYRHVEVYDPVSDTWTRKADMPTGRWGLATVVLDGLIYAMGGRAGSSSSYENEAYNPITDTWTSKEPMQYSRTGLAAGVIGNKIYAIGGHQGPPIVMLSSLEQYNPLLTSIDIEPESPFQPKQPILYPNYPNPFNPTTSILYSIPRMMTTSASTSFSASLKDLHNDGQQLRSEMRKVKLVIYDLRGKEVALLVNEQKHPGNYEVTWDATSLPSGVYFYRLEVYSNSTGIATFTKSRKLVLLK